MNPADAPSRAPVVGQKQRRTATTPHRRLSSCLTYSAFAPEPAQEVLVGTEHLHTEPEEPKPDAEEEPEQDI